MVVTEAVEPERLLFVEECGVHTSPAPISTATLPEESAYICRWRATGARTLYATSYYDHRRDGAVVAGRGRGETTARVFFETYYVAKVLAPSLRAGRIVVMDDLSAPRPKRI